MYILNKIFSIKKIVYFFMQIIINCILPHYYKLTLEKYSLNTNNKSDKKKIIASLTSYGFRINNSWIAIESIFRQKVKPDKIVLWISKDDKRYLSNNKFLKKQIKKGLEINFVEDIKAHTKYFYSFQKYPNELIVTFDDDIFYTKNTISELLKTKKIFPNCIVSNRCHEIKFNERERKIKSYNLWQHQISKSHKPSHFLFATGVGAVLYEPKLFDKEVLNKNAIIEYCEYGDDIWLKIMEIISKIKVVQTRLKLFNGHQYRILLSQKEGLQDINIGANMNDKQLFRTLNRYPQVADTLSKY